MFLEQNQQGKSLEQKKLDSIITQGLSGQINLIGFPYDMGAERDKIQNGQENGPDCMRRFIPQVGPLLNVEYKINISNLNVQDYGNIVIPEKEEQVLEEVIAKLETKVLSVYNKGNIPIILGGTKDCVYPAIKALIQKKQNPLLLTLSAGFNLRRMYDGDKVSSQSVLRKIVTELSQQKQNNFQIQYFGVQKHNIQNEDLEIIKQNKQYIKDYIQIDHIRKFQCDKSEQQCEQLDQPITQGGQLFQQMVSNTQNINSIHLSISMESINASSCPGVSRPSVVGGFTCEEIIEIMFQAGIQKNIVSLDITDYNPTKEDIRTGFLYANMIYYFILGYSLRSQNILTNQNE